VSAGRVRPGWPQRLRDRLEAIDRRLRAREGIVRAALVLLGLALLAVLGAAAWPIVVELRSEHAAASDPRPIYVRAVQQKIHFATQAALADLQARKLPASLTVRIQVDAVGNLTSTRVMESSGDAGLDEVTLRIIRTAAPFEPFPPEMRRTTRIVELNSEFHFD
jgi:TonB family protein